MRGKAPQPGCLPLIAAKSAKTVMKRRSLLLLPPLLAPLLLLPRGGRAALSDGAYTVEVHELALPVGTHGLLRVTLRPGPGHRVLKHYRHTLRRLSALDDAVRFDSDTVSGEASDEAVVFEVGVTPLAPGPHPINGVMRVGYIAGEDDLSMVSLPLITRIIGLNPA